MLSIKWGSLSATNSTCTVWFLTHCLLLVFIEFCFFKSAFLAGRGLRSVSLQERLPFPFPLSPFLFLPSTHSRGTSPRCSCCLVAPQLPEVNRDGGSLGLFHMWWRCEEAEPGLSTSGCALPTEQVQPVMLEQGLSPIHYFKPKPHKTTPTSVHEEVLFFFFLFTFFLSFFLFFPFPSLACLLQLP